jgi:hypothetical protein
MKFEYQLLARRKYMKKMCLLVIIREREITWINCVEQTRKRNEAVERSRSQRYEW